MLKMGSQSLKPGNVSRVLQYPNPISYFKKKGLIEAPSL